MSDDLPSVSAVVPARDDAADLESAIESVLRQDYAGPLEVVVAVAPSTDDTERVAAQLATRQPRVRVVPNPGGLTSCALNAAIAVASGTVVVRVDAHSVLPSDYVGTAVATLLRTGASNVGGIQDPHGRTVAERAVAVAMRSPLGSGGARYRSSGRAGATDTVYLGVFSRDALEDVGGFDETLVRNQDYELNWRLRAAGHVVWFDPALRVTYRPRSSLRGVARQYADYGRWKCEVLRRHPSSLRLRQLLPPVVVVALGASLVTAPLVPAATLVPGLYATALVIGGVAGARREPWPVRLRVPVVLVAMHVAWGSAFIAELVTRSLRRRR